MKAERLFEAEATLRLRATQLDKNQRPGCISQDTARKNLRVAAIAYADVVRAVDKGGAS